MMLHPVHNSTMANDLKGNFKKKQSNFTLTSSGTIFFEAKKKADSKMNP